MSPDQFWPLATIFAFIAGLIVGITYMLWAISDDEND